MKKNWLVLICLISFSVFSLGQKKKDIESIIKKYSDIFEWKIMPKYEGILDVSETNIVSISKGKYFAYMTLDEEVLTPFEWKFNSPAYKCGVGVVYNSYGHWQYMIDIHNNGKKITDEKFQYIFDFIDGYAITEKGGDKYAIIDSAGNFIIEPSYRDIKRPNNLKAIIEGKSNEYLAVRRFKGGQLALYGYVNIKGEWKKEPKYAMTYSRDGSYYPVSKTFFKNDMGLLDSDLNEMIPCDYDDIIVINDNNIKVRKRNEKWGIINEKNETVVPFEFDLIGRFNGGKAYFERGDEHGYIYLKEHKIEVKGKLDRAPIRFILGNTFEGSLVSFSFEEYKDAKAFGICRFKNDKLEVVIPQKYSDIYILGVSGNIIVIEKIKSKYYYGLYNKDLELIIDPRLKEFDHIQVPNSSGYFTVIISEIGGVAKFK